MNWRRLFKREKVIRTTNIVATFQYLNADVIYGIEELGDDRYQAVIITYPPGTIKYMQQHAGKTLEYPPESVQREVVEVGGLEVKIKYKEVGAFSEWPPPITIRVPKK